MKNARKLLIIKTSSLGDVVHMLPALHDALQHHPHLHIDWVVEENFQEVLRWHNGIQRVLPVAIRRWRKRPFAKQVRHEISQFKQQLRQEHYDYVLDSQGLLKSALITCLSRGTRYGYDRYSIREPLASFCYSHKLPVSRKQHAILRNRLLTANALGYSIENLALEHGIQDYAFPPSPHDLPPHYIVALHGTSRPDKEWPVAHWQHFIKQLAEQGIHTLLPWGNTREQQRAQQLAQHPYAHVLPRSSLSELAGIMQQAQGVIGMDTGLMHIAAALNQRGLALYPVTKTILTGIAANSSAQQAILSVEGKAALDCPAITQQFQDMMQA